MQRSDIAILIQIAYNISNLFDTKFLDGNDPVEYP
jgi:hypothetical protein